MAWKTEKGGKFRNIHCNPVLVIAFSLADGVIDNRVVEGMHREVKGAYGVASPLGFQGITDDGVLHDCGEFEPVSGVIVPLTYLAGENRIIYGVYGKEQAVDTVTAVHGSQGVVIDDAFLEYLASPHDGVPLANLPFGFEDIGLANEEVKRDEAVASVDVFINAVAGDCAFGGCFRVSQGEAVTVIGFSLADGVIYNCFMFGTAPVCFPLPISGLSQMPRAPLSQ